MEFKTKIHAPKNDPERRSYLWGSKAAVRKIDSPLFLSVRVEDTGEAIELWVVETSFNSDTTASDNPTMVATLEPSQVYTVPLKGLRGVFARALQRVRDTYVQCCITGTPT